MQPLHNSTPITDPKKRAFKKDFMPISIPLSKEFCQRGMSLVFLPKDNLDGV